MAMGTLEGVENETVSSNFELLNFALSSKSVRQIKNRARYKLSISYVYVTTETQPIKLVRIYGLYISRCGSC